MDAKTVDVIVRDTGKNWYVSWGNGGNTVQDNLAVSVWLNDHCKTATSPMPGISMYDDVPRDEFLRFIETIT